MVQHLLMNPQLNILEIRNTLGRGARWGLENQVVFFRGFIEPQMENGHEVGWRH